MLTPSARGTLYALGFSAWIWAFGVIWFSLGAAMILAIAGASAVIVAGLLHEVDDCGYRDTVYGIERDDFNEWGTELEGGR